LACGSPATSNCSAQGLPVTAESGANPTRARAKVGQGRLGEGPGGEAEPMRGPVVVELQRGGGSAATQMSGAGRSRAGRCARVGGGVLLEGRRRRGRGGLKEQGPRLLARKEGWEGRGDRGRRSRGGAAVARSRGRGGDDSALWGRGVSERRRGRGRCESGATRLREQAVRAGERKRWAGAWGAVVGVGRRGLSRLGRARRG
jgi:hypothetical protein